jgi:cytochrome P450
VQVTGRTTLEEIDEIGGIPLAKGQSVVCLLGSANRDPAVYANPDKLDIRRTDIRPLSFGGGLHYCVGAQLARLEGEILPTDHALSDIVRTRRVLRGPPDGVNL